MSFNEVPATRARILSEAERLFAAHGYDGVSMREIAEASVVAKANIYYYFRDKESLYMEVLQADMAALVAALDAAGSAGGTCRDRVTRMAETYWDLMRAKNSLIRLTLRQFGGLESELRGLVARYQDELVRPIISVLSDGVAGGELRAVNERLAAAAFLGMLSIFVASRLLDIEMAHSSQEMVSETVALFFDGVTARPAQPPAGAGGPA